MKEPSFILRCVCLCGFFSLEHIKSFPTSGPLHVDLPLPETLNRTSFLSTSGYFSPSASQFNCPFHGEASPQHATEKQPPLLSSILAPFFFLRSLLSTCSYLSACFRLIPHPTLRPIGGGVLLAIQQPLLGTALGAHQLSINTYANIKLKCSVYEIIMMVHLFLKVLLGKIKGA